MIKKEIKKHNFNDDLVTTSLNILGTMAGDYSIAIGAGNYAIGNATIIGVGNTAIQYPNTWQVNLGGQERLVLDADGDMRLSGQIRALGAVSWNQETQQLQFWDGTQWIPINNPI